MIPCHGNMTWRRAICCQVGSVFYGQRILHLPKNRWMDKSKFFGKIHWGGRDLFIGLPMYFFLFWYLFWSDICAMVSFFLVEKKQKGTMVDSKKHPFPLEDEERTGKNFTSYKASFWVSSVQMHVHIGANLMCDSSTYIHSTNIHPP